MDSNRQRALRAALAGVMTLGTLVASSGSASAAVRMVTGKAFGYHAYNLTLFGSPQPEAGPTPLAALAADATNSPQSATVPTALVSADVATLFTSDRIDVSTSGTVGSAGGVQSSTTIQNVNKATTQLDTGSEILTATTVASQCGASETAITGGTAITNGTLQTDSGFDQNRNGIYADPGDIVPVVVILPAEPAPNTTYDGVIRLSATGPPDSFRVVLNERVVGPNSITVNAVHEYFGTTPQSRLKGDLILGQSVCGLTVNVPPTAVDDSYYANLFGVGVPAPGVLGNDTDPDGGPMTASLVTGPSNGAVTLNPDGSFTYAPNFLFTGMDAFTYRVTDNRGESDTATVVVTVDLV